MWPETVRVENSNTKNAALMFTRHLRKYSTKIYMLTKIYAFHWVCLIQNHVLWIRDILEWIRIRICEFVPLTDRSRAGFRAGSRFFPKWLTRCQQKIWFFSEIVCLFFVKVHLHQMKNQKQVKKIVEIKVFSTFFACRWKAPEKNNDGFGSGRFKNIRIYGADPQH